MSDACTLSPPMTDDASRPLGLAARRFVQLAQQPMTGSSA